MNRLDEIREQNFQDVIDKVRQNKFAHITSIMVTEKRLNQLKAMFVCASVPYQGNGKCFLLCR